MTEKADAELRAVWKRWCEQVAAANDMTYMSRVAAELEAGRAALEISVTIPPPTVIDFTKLPLAPDPDPKRTEERTRDLLIAEGRAAFRAGLPVTKCPPFKDPDMGIDWRFGWRWEQEDEAARKR